MSMRPRDGSVDGIKASIGSGIIESGNGGFEARTWGQSTSRASSRLMMAASWAQPLIV